MVSILLNFVRMLNFFGGVCHHEKPSKTPYRSPLPIFSLAYTLFRCNVLRFGSSVHVCLAFAATE